MHKLQGKHRDLGLNTGVGNTSKKRQFFRGVSEEEAGLTEQMGREGSCGEEASDQKKQHGQSLTNGIR